MALGGYILIISVLGLLGVNPSNFGGSLRWSSRIAPLQGHDSVVLPEGPCRCLAMNKARLNDLIYKQVLGDKHDMHLDAQQPICSSSWE